MDLTAIAQRINTAADETTARAALAPLTAAQLRAVAAALPVHHRAGDSKATIVGLIVQHRVTRRLSADAIGRVRSLHREETPPPSRYASHAERVRDALRVLVAETGRRTVAVETLGYATEPAIGRTDLLAALDELAAAGRVRVDGDAVTLL